MSDSLQLLVHTPDGQHALRLDEGDARPLTDVLRRQSIPLNTRCGGKGLCDGCKIELVAGHLQRITTGQMIETDGQPVSLRACEYRPANGKPTVIRVPQRSLLAYQPQVVSDFRLNVPLAHAPLWEAGDGHRPIEGVALGAAIDIGTTTVAVALVDLSSGHVLAKTSAFNKQMHLGDDVLTRINLCMVEPGKLAELHDAIAVQTITPLIHEAMEQAEASIDQLVCVTVAANTTMLHLLAKVDPTPMGMVPFTPAFLDHRVLTTHELNLPGDAQVHLLPGAAAYVGADLTAGVISSGLRYDDGPSMLVDVGTNGEIILKHDGKLHGCATAAGPAFEGARLSSGMRAGQGAVSHINLVDNPADVQIEVIGNAKPAGLCGSAYVDFLAQARLVGLLSETGRFVDGVADDRLETVPDYGRSFRVATAPGSGGVNTSGGHRHVVISETDIASLLQAKAAIAAGITTLLDRCGLKPSDVKRLYLAGGFGMHMNIDNTIRCGLLPGFAADQIELVGNTSLAGAYLTLLDRGTLTEMAAAGQEMEVVELNQDPNFEMTFIDHLSLP